jgi:hypothetical protein
MLVDRSTTSYKKDIQIRGGIGMIVPTISKSLQLHTITQDLCDTADCVLSRLNSSKAGSLRHEYT